MSEDASFSLAPEMVKKWFPALLRVWASGSGWAVPVLLDSTGEFCDALGIYKDPVNVIVDRNGVVRYAGLNGNGLKQAVAIQGDDAKEAELKARLDANLHRADPKDRQ